MTTASPTVEQAVRTVNSALTGAREAFISTVESLTMEEVERHAERVAAFLEEAENEYGRWGAVLDLGIQRLRIYAELSEDAVRMRRLRV